MICENLIVGQGRGMLSGSGRGVEIVQRIEKWGGEMS